MTDIKNTTQKGKGIIWDFENAYRGHDIFDAYENPSYKKVESFETIRRRAFDTPGYNYDLKVVAASCYTYSTVYSYTDIDGTIYIVKDTKSNTYRVPLA